LRTPDETQGFGGETGNAQRISGEFLAGRILLARSSFAVRLNPWAGRVIVNAFAEEFH